MTLLSPMQLYKDATSKETPMKQCENLEDVVTEIAGELSQIEWVGVATKLRIDPDKLHLVTTANGCDFHRQKTLGLLCWIEDEPSTATFDRLVDALVQVEADGLAGDVKSFCRLMNMRKSNAARRHTSLQTEYYSMQFGPQSRYPQLPKSAHSHGQWKLADIPLPQFLCNSPAVAFFPSRSVPSNPTFDLTSSVSIQGLKLSLVHRDPWTVRMAKKAVRPATIASKSQQPRKRRALASHKRSGQIDIRTTIKTAVPLTNNVYRDCHPEEVEEKIAGKLFDYLLNGNGSRELLSMVSTLESIDGLVVKKLRRGSIMIETSLHKPTALKALWGHFESGQLNDMFQEQLISDNSLKMAGAFAISLETSIDRSELEACMQQIQGQNQQQRKTTGTGNRRSLHSSNRRASPPRLSYKQSARLPFTGLHGNSQNRVSTVPTSRSISVDLAPSVRTVKPEPRGPSMRGDKAKIPGKSDSVSGVIFADASTYPKIEETKAEEENNENDNGPERQSAPPPTPDIEQDSDDKAEAKDDEELRGDDKQMKDVLEDLQKRTEGAESAYRQFDTAVFRRFVDALKDCPKYDIDRISDMSDLRKYATILRQNDSADTAQLVEEFVKVTETLDCIHRDVTSKIWLKVGESASASAKSRDSNGSHRRSPLRNRVTQSIETWQKMLDPKHNFGERESPDLGDLSEVLSLEELKEYGGLLSHIPLLLETAKACQELINHYMRSPG